MFFFLIVWHFIRLLSTVAFKIRLVLFRAITLNISVHTCYWAARYCLGGEISDDRKYVCVRRLVRATPIQEIPSMHLCRKKTNGRRNSQKALRVPLSLQWRRFLPGGDGSWSLSVENNANRFLFQKAKLLIHNGRSYYTTRLKNPLSADQWTSVVGVLLLPPASCA